MFLIVIDNIWVDDKLYRILFVKNAFPSGLIATYFKLYKRIRKREVTYWIIG